jgi:hypothetical protein
MNKARIQRTGAGGGIQPSRIQKVGSVHAGIKVLTKAVENIPGMKEKYAEGLAAGASFDEIGAALKRVPGCPAKDPLTMKNAPYFTVRQGDFRTPGAAQAIMDAYAEVRFPDPEPRLYAFPIVFPSDDLDLVYRQEFVAWQASGKLRWSEMRGEDLVCMRQGDIPVDKTNRKRMGAIPAVEDRLCDPNDCQLFATGKCWHWATLAFWIPVVKGVGVIELTFKSIYAKLGIGPSLEAVMLGLGRISGLHNGKPIFLVSKSLDGVTRANFETGRREKTDHWIIHVEASGLDMMEVLGAGQDQAALPAPDPVEVRALEAPSAHVVDDHVAAAQTDAHRYQQGELGSAPLIDATEIKEFRGQLAALRDTLGWDDADLLEWVDGQGYKVESPAHNLECLRDMVAKLAGAAQVKALREAAPKDAPDEETPF